MIDHVFETDPILLKIHIVNDFKVVSFDLTDNFPPNQALVVMSPSPNKYLNQFKCFSKICGWYHTEAKVVRSKQRIISSLSNMCAIVTKN